LQLPLLLSLGPRSRAFPNSCGIEIKRGEKTSKGKESLPLMSVVASYQKTGKSTVPMRKRNDMTSKKTHLSRGASCARACLPYKATLSRANNPFRFLLQGKGVEQVKHQVEDRKIEASFKRAESFNNTKGNYPPGVASSAQR